MKTKFVYIVYIVLFLALVLFTLNFNFIEGDDASTVMFHLLGRNADIQMPYSSYHSMFDTVLSIFDSNNEWMLRHAAIGISFVSGLLLLLSLAYLIRLKSKQSSKNIAMLLMVLPFVIPEILFNSLIVNPTLISFTLLLISHIFLIKYLKSNHVFSLIVAIICFGLGVSFRWSNGFYLFVLFGDFILTDASNIRFLFSVKRLKRSLLIFPFFIIAVVLCIHLSGYSLIDIYTTYSKGTSYVEEMETSYSAMFASAITYLTPSFLLLLLLGVISSIKKQQHRNLVLLFFACIPYMIVGFYPSFKYMISALFVLVLICIQGLSMLKRRSFKVGFMLVLFLPWLIGVQLFVNSAWGPGFEVSKKTIQNSNVSSYNPDQTISIDNVKVVFGSGMAVPTPEGPRPIFGFAYVFLNDWNEFITKNNLERQSAVQYAIDKNVNILQDVRHSLISTKMIELGYYTDQFVNRKVGEVFEREFFKKDDTLIINVFKNKKNIFKNKNIDALIEQSNEVVIYSSYTNIISKLRTKYKDRFHQKGAYWGVLEAK